MGMNWTEEQMKVITLRKKNLLVSAAAGSGKTAVLVERIIRRILDETNPIDMDRMLIVTFTSAAAAEMRERIGAAIDKALSENPSSAHLMKQTTLLHHAQITTIHSFCLNLIRNYFHQVDLEPNFRIAEEGELNLLKEDVMDEVLNRNYEAKEKAFLNFAESFATGKSDDGLKEMIFKLYDFAMSNPWPREWLYESLDGYRFSNFEEMEQKPWMKSLMTYLNRILRDLSYMAKKNVLLSLEEDGPQYANETARRDEERVLRLAAADSYETLSREISGICFDRLPSKRGYDGEEEKLLLFKEQRDEIKDAIKKIKEKFFFASEEELAKRVLDMAPLAEETARLTREFLDAFDAKKREKNILDFDDLEHFALKILVDEKTKACTQAALQCQKLFEEVMIDEYQDGNLVQESLMRAVSREECGCYNRFMVGDVKQSIYRFRLARPELFMEKYDAYPITEEGNCQKIELHKNFRSRSEVLDVTNHVFYQIMKKDLGGVAYNEAAALYQGAKYPCCEDMEAELLLADSSEELLEEAQISDSVSLEAELVASKIQSMMRTQRVTDKKTGRLRNIRYSDIVILLRSFGAYADVFTEVFEQKRIPAHASSKTGYFKTQEIRTILCFLRILDNPRQDIPLAAVLRSPMFGYSDEELAEIRISGEGRSFHGCVLEPEETKLSKSLFLKLKDFLKQLSHYRDLAEEQPIHELLYRILEDTGYARYAAAMPGGARRKANIEMLLEKAAAYEKTSYRGLFHFIRYMDRLQKYEVDYGEAEVVSENANAVRIMTIHKSKGLEFPIVFLCQTAKNFNRMDARSSMVIHPDLGVAFDYINPVKRIRGAALYKRALAKQVELESQGEELRVLYVAMTRAKEKLIMTGVVKNAEEKMERLALRLHKGEEITYLTRARAASFLDWILPALMVAGDRDKIKIWKTGDFVLEEIESQWEEANGMEELARRMAECDEEADAFVEEQLSYRYPREAETSRRIKYSVSELKHRRRQAVSEEEELLANALLEEEIVPYIPRFAGGEAETSQGALRGSAMHRAVECLPIELLAKSGGLEEEIDFWLEQLVQNGFLTKELRLLVQKEPLMRFYQTDLALRMKKAAQRKELYVEQPFVMGRAADEIERDKSDTLALVQGIVDVFFIEEDEIVLLDYKTDAIREKEEFIRRYREQLKWYQLALEQNLGKKVKEIYIYSFYLSKVILVSSADS